MYTLVSDVGVRKAVVTEGPSLLLSMLVAEAFYKFHSFGLEFLAMLTTWFVFSYLLSFARGLLAARQSTRT